ncbi:MAG: DUF726 domain-containing protein [Pirellulales bacterium]
MPVHRGILGDAEARLADSKISAVPGTNGYCHESARPRRCHAIELHHTRLANFAKIPVMSRIAQLTLLVDDRQHDEANVFIHGYKAISSQEQFAAVVHAILTAKLRGRVYLLHWKSGKWSTTRGVLAARTAYRAARVSKIFNPWMLALDVGLVTASEIAQFKMSERRSERLGKNLKRHLSRIPDAKSRPINLIGHSLGARVIHAALAVGGWSDYNINDCVFLGGAADSAADNWPACLAQIDGRLYNGYSKYDTVLTMTPDLRKRVGSRAMSRVVIDGENKIVNKNCGRMSHTDYWQRLAFILPKVWSK